MAELRIVGLAAPLANALRSRPMNEQLDALALTVWPALLAEPLTATERDTRWTVHPGESADDYLARLCAGPLVAECGNIVPEQRAVIVRSIVMRRADERMQRSLATCLDCKGDPAWDRIGWTWESLDREATGHVADLRQRESRGHVVAAQ